MIASWRARWASLTTLDVWRLRKVAMIHALETLPVAGLRLHEVVTAEPPLELAHLRIALLALPSPQRGERAVLELLHDTGQPVILTVSLEDLLRSIQLAKMAGG